MLEMILTQLKQKSHENKLRTTTLTEGQELKIPCPSDSDDESD
jgi:hypothetical protein